MQNGKIDFKQKVLELKETLKDYPNVTIVGASKYLNIEETKALALAGIKDIGENRTDMFLEKYEALKGLGIKWHFFGTLQSRKIKDVANKIDCLHTLDKVATAMELDAKLEDTLDCFIQINISEDPSKSGILPTKLKTFIKSLSKCNHIRVIGLMCIAKMTFDDDVLIAEFSKMQKLKQEVEELNLDYAPCHELSMGMTNDYQVALQYGATFLRLGHIFLE